MELSLNGIKVSIADPEIVAIVRRHLLAPEPAALLPRGDLPAIGADYAGGLYAGLTLHDNRPHALVLLPEEREDLKWEEATAWAQQLDGTLPSRIDQLVLWQNLKAQFQPTWYWSCEPYAGLESYAWYQNFSDGGQSGTRKYRMLCARAVRRVPIESLTHSSI